MADATVNTDSLVSAINNISSLIEQITQTPKPSYTVDGHHVSWTEYFESLCKQRLVLRQQLAQELPVEEIGIGI